MFCNKDTSYLCIFKRIIYDCKNYLNIYIKCNYITAAQQDYFLNDLCNHIFSV